MRIERVDIIEREEDAVPVEVALAAILTEVNGSNDVSAVGVGSPTIVGITETELNCGVPVPTFVTEEEALSLTDEEVEETGLFVGSVVVVTVTVGDKTFVTLNDVKAEGDVRLDIVMGAEPELVAVTVTIVDTVSVDVMFDVAVTILTMENTGVKEVVEESESLVLKVKIADEVGETELDADEVVERVTTFEAVIESVADGVTEVEVVILCPPVIEPDTLAVISVVDVRILDIVRVAVAETVEVDVEFEETDEVEVIE